MFRGKIAVVRTFVFSTICLGLARVVHPGSTVKEAFYLRDGYYSIGLFSYLQITGAAGGMGREIALQLSSEGCNVAICDVRDKEMQETLCLCEKVSQHTQAKAMVVNLLLLFVVASTSESGASYLSHKENDFARTCALVNICLKGRIVDVTNANMVRQFRDDVEKEFGDTLHILVRAL